MAQITGRVWLLSMLLYPGATFGQLTLAYSVRANFGTLYEVIAVPDAPLLGGADQFRVTMVAGSMNGLLSCSENGFAAQAPTSSVVGADPLQGQSLVPFAAVRRTTVLTPNDFTVTFNPVGTGRLTIGSGTGAVDICDTNVMCAGGAADAIIAPLDYCDADVPAACIASDITAACSGTSTRSAFAFGLAADAEHHCLETPTTNSTTCGTPPADGFTLHKGQLIVFVYNPGMSGFVIGAAGVGVDSNGVNVLSCPANSVVTSDAQSPSAPPPPPTITRTPTGTLTVTATPSHTLLPGQATYTPTLTPTITPTFSHTPAETPTSTYTPTRTLNPTFCTRTPNPTGTFTATSSPTSPSPTATDTPMTASPTHTATATSSASPTTAPPACAGDCNLDGQTTIDEVITLVNVALDALSVDECRAGDRNADGAITIDEIIQAVDVALGQCPAST